MKADWKLVTEQTPPEGKILMVTDNWGNIIFPAAFLKDFNARDWDFFTWDEDTNGYTLICDSMHTIVAWIEAPDPYEKRGE